MPFARPRRHSARASTVSTSLRARLVALLAATTLTALAAVALVRPASAHDYLIGSVPEQQTTVEAAPTEVILEFNTSIGEQFAQVAVVDDAGATFQVGEPVVDGPTLTQAVDGLQPGMAVTISYRVVSSDGHPIGGTVPFAIAAMADTDAPRPTPTQEPGADAATTTDSTTESAVMSSEESSTISPALWVAAAAVAAMLAGAALALSRRRSRATTSP
jgi:methionine-rich copper-binding protein CopC